MISLYNFSVEQHLQANFHKLALGKKKKKDSSNKIN